MKNVNFAPVLVFPIRKCFFGPQDGFQNALRSPQDGSKRVLRSNFFRHRFCLRFWTTFGPVLVPSWPPFGRPKRPQNRSKNRSKIVLLQDGLQDRSKTAQEPPKTLPGLPRTPSRPPKTLPKRPQEPPGPLLDRPKNRKLRNRRKHVEKKSTVVAYNGHSIPSLERIESQFTTVEPPRVAAVVARSALQ